MRWLSVLFLNFVVTPIHNLIRTSSYILRKMKKDGHSDQSIRERRMKAFVVISLYWYVSYVTIRTQTCSLVLVTMLVHSCLQVYLHINGVLEQILAKQR